MVQQGTPSNSAALTKANQEGVRSQDDSASPAVSTKPGGDDQPVSAAATTTAQAISSKSNAGNSPPVPTSVVPPTTTQESVSKSNKGSPISKPTMLPSTSSAISPSNTPEKVPSTPAVSSSIAQMTSPTNAPGKPSPTPTLSPSTAPRISPTSKPGDPPPIPVPSPSANPSASSGPLVSTTAVTSRVAQHQSSPSGSSGSSQATTATSPRAASGIHPLERLSSTTASTTAPAGSLSPGLKDHISTTKSASQQPHSSPSSEVQGPASSTRPGGVSTSVAPSAGSVSAPHSPTSKTSQSLTPGSVDKVSLPATTTLTSGAGQTSHGQGPTTTKPVIADRSPTSTQPLSPTSSHQTTSSRPGPQHPNETFQNEVICEDQMQNSWPIISLKEAKTCAEWKTLTLNDSLFKTFCSTDRYTYEPSRDKCTVTLASAEPRSQRWAVRAVVHLHLDPEKVFKELKEKRDELEELGITNVTFHDEQQEEEIKDRFSTPLIITIVTLAGSLLLVAAIYGCCHQRFSHKKDQHLHPDVPGFDDGHVALIFNQRLTEELQTMENGYHDNPTLEVMETSSEMQEKKVNLNGELGDSWIVPLDTLLKDELEEEEDTHL
ncbi:PREDICTED: podocalyxin [Tinamus guttatus]|uniref:podocalyxin n=1 Tax=Tinamus guttatus TaxID=94827 RepID=UPI00052F3C7A|nr:PREDICTED: podocalyxin [Tinamus guttatus]